MKNNINKLIMLKLKPEFQGVVITRNKLGIGTLTFDANNVSEDSYANYAKLGFEDLFFEELAEPSVVEVAENQVIEYQGVIEPNLNKKKK